MRSGIALFVLPALLICGTVHAQSNRETGCTDPDPDIRIAACSVIIEGAGPDSDSDVAIALTNRGGAYTGKGDYRRALLDLNRAAAIAPDFGVLLNNRCYALAAAGRPEQGLTDCDRALALLPGNEQVLDSRGYAYFRFGRYREAIRDFDEVLAHSPMTAALYIRGIAKLKIGDPSGQADLDQATSLDRNIAENMAKMGVAPPILTEAARSASAPDLRGR
jgi:tetratricopeptide (TPR) repeat protein